MAKVINIPSAKNFVSKVSEKYAGNYQGSFLFGSQARGTARNDSDVDILVLLQHVDHWEKRDIIDLAYDEYLATGIDIAPLIMSVGDYERQKKIGVPLIIEIEHDKVRL